MISNKVVETIVGENEEVKHDDIPSPTKVVGKRGSAKKGGKGVSKGASEAVPVAEEVEVVAEEEDSSARRSSRKRKST